jgi:SAM-dependent methyltransferase
VLLSPCENTARSRTAGNATGIWTDWEFMWAPYERGVYEAVLSETRSDDVVLEIGAGDLRLARLLAKKALGVYAIEIRPELLREDIRENGRLPSNLWAICADARLIPFPTGVTLAVLLMRHCTHFQLYAGKLRSIGCRRLVTNARWRMGVEVVDLMAPRKNIGELTIGWYACLCGSVGFRPNAPELLTRELLSVTQEVLGCPNCTQAST